MRMDEIVDWVDRWFEPTFGEAEAQALFGAMIDPAAPLARAAPRDARFNDVIFERVQHPAPFLSGVQLSLAKPETLAWNQVVARYGEPRLLGVPWDDWGAAVMYGFKLNEKGQSGQLVLSVKGKPEANVMIERLVLRRFPPSPQGR
jgi:glutathione S-transferase